MLTWLKSHDAAVQLFNSSTLQPFNHSTTQLRNRATRPPGEETRCRQEEAREGVEGLDLAEEGETEKASRGKVPRGEGPGGHEVHWQEAETSVLNTMYKKYGELNDCHLDMYNFCVKKWTAFLNAKECE